MLCKIKYKKKKKSKSFNIQIHHNNKKQSQRDLYKQQQQSKQNRQKINQIKHSENNLILSTVNQHKFFFLKQILSIKSIKFLFFIYLIIQVISSLQLTHSQPTFLITSNYANTNTNYQIIFFQTINLNANSIIKIIFPSQYSIASLHQNSPYSGYNSSVDSCLGDCSLVTVSYKAYTFTITNAILTPITSFFIFQYTIFNIPNPSVGTTGQYIAKIIDPNGTQVYSSNITGQTFVAPPLAVSAIIDNPQIWSVSPVTFTIQPLSNLQHVDYIKMIFPNVWPNQKRINTTLSTPVTCTSSSHPTAYCIQSNQNLQILNLNPIGGNISPNIIILSVKSIMNPSVIINLTNITIQTYNPSNVLLQQNSNLQISGLLNSTLRNTVIKIGSVSIRTCSIIISIKLPRYSLSGDKITVQFPSELTFFSSSLTITVTQGGNSTSASPTPNQALRTITVSPFSSTKIQSQIVITVNGIIRPHGSLTTSDFSIYTTRTQSNNANMDNITCCYLKFHPDQTLIASIIPSNYQRLATGVTYNITITVQLELIITDSIIIQFSSSDYPNAATQIQCSSMSSSTGASLTASPACTFLPSSTKMRVYNFLASNTLNSQAFTLILSNVTNPSLPITSNFNIYTFSTAPIQINAQKSINITFQSATINSLSVIPSSFKVAEEAVSLTITVAGLGNLLKGNIIQVNIPKQIILNVNTEISCTINSVTSHCYTDVSTGNNKVLIQIRSNSLGPLNTIIIQNIKNPISFAPTQSFSVKIISDSSLTAYILEQSNSSINSSISMSLQSLLLSVTVYPQIQEITSNNNKLTIQIASPFGFYQLGNTFSMQVFLSQTSYILSSISNCQSTYNIFSCNFTSNSSGIFTPINNIDLNGGSSDINFLQFNITNVIIVSSTNQWIKINIKDANGYQSLSQNYTITNRTLISNQLQFTMTQNNYVMGSSATITISYSLSNTFVSNSSTLLIGYILVSVPFEYSPNSIVNISSVSSSSFSFNVNNNPMVKQSGIFRLYAYSSSNLLLAVSSISSQNLNTNRFSIKCQLPCKTCSSTNISQCLSCYLLSSISAYNIFDNASHTCLDHCSTYLFTNSSTNQIFCLPCNSSCYTCNQNNPNNCTSCSNPNFLYLNNNTCLASCPGLYYQSLINQSRICLSCQLQCKLCDNLTYCTSCQLGFFLFQNQCLQACPTKTVSTTSGSQNICINCTNNCLKCNTSACLACDSNYYLHLGQCISGCPFGLYPSYQEVCSACLCQSCINFNYKCLSCFSASTKNKFFNFTCLSNCPQGYYSDNLKICQACPNQCLLCYNTSFCTRCKQNYVYDNGTCLTQCSNGKVSKIDNSTSLLQSSIKICKNCQYPCLTCQYTQIFCLSCASSSSITLLFHNNTCLTSCPAPLHPFPPYCKSCTAQCQQCDLNNPYNCSQCASDYYFLNNTCYASCPAGYFQQLTSKQCLNCYIACATCVNATNCTTCIPGYYLFNWLCYASCPQVPVKYYVYKGACTLCQSQCLSCLSSPVQCTSCSNVNSYLYNSITKQCTLNCTDPYFQNSNSTQCISCQSPCITCDHTYFSCKTCNSSIHVLFSGSCISSCPFSYYKNSTLNQCQKCKSPCLQCTEDRCQSCESYAFMVGKQCLLQCPQQLPFQSNGFCTACLSIQFCSICDQTKVNQFTCYQCSYPYVLFFDQCLNSCPQNYTTQQMNSTNINDSSYLICVESQSYKQYLLQLQSFNQPTVPPYIFFITWIVLAVLVGILSKYKFYKYTYLVGYFIGILGLIDFCIIIYYLFYVLTRYQGQKISISGGIDFSLGKQSLWYILVTGLCCCFLINIVYLIVVILMIYLKDIRYRQWKQDNIIAFIMSIIFSIIIGTRGQKLFYSKCFGLDFFSYRILSVSKFYQEDLFTLLQIFISDIIQLTSVIIVAYNVQMSYTVLFLCSIEIIIIKCVLWCLLIYDLRKKDIGFFKGDQQWAQQQQQKILKEQTQKKSNDQFQSLIKLIRTKSAGQLHHDLQWDIDPIQFISQYDPNDYQDVIKVPNKKIQKYIYKGKFRKGRKITIQEKLLKFAAYFKPLPKPLQKDQDVYLWKQIYWRPPKALKIKQKQQQALQEPSQQNLLKLLQDKQLQYKDQLDQIQLLQSGKKLNYKNENNKKYNQRNSYHNNDDSFENSPYYKPKQNIFYNTNNYRYNNSNNRNRNNNGFNVFDDLDETIPNQTIGDFYPNYQQRNKKDSNDFTLDIDDMMNLNYAKKRHLIKQKQEEKSMQMRVLRHQPRRKRNRVSQLQKLQKQQRQRQRDYLQSGNKSKDFTLKSKDKRSGSNQKPDKNSYKQQFGGTTLGFGSMFMKNQK